MKSLRSSASLGVLAALIASPAMAQDQSDQGAQAEERQGGVGTIVVTATKRSEDLQDVAISVNAIGEEALDDLGISTFDDYLVQLPNVTAGGSGPGQSTIYVRGLASTTPNLTMQVLPASPPMSRSISTSSHWRSRVATWMCTQPI